MGQPHVLNVGGVGCIRIWCEGEGRCQQGGDMHTCDHDARSSAHAHGHEKALTTVAGGEHSVLDS